MTLDPTFELLLHAGTFLICHGTARPNHGGKQTKNKCQVSHPGIIKKSLRMATLIPMSIPTQDLLDLYVSGWFPMAMGDGSFRCFSPDPRGILPLDGFRIPHGSRKVLRDPGWEVRIDTAFEDVIRSCASRDETWIDETIVQSYLAVHREGLAHSVETWREGQLVGGLYGVSLGGVFFGESMFSHQAGASKVALVALVERLRRVGFVLLDIQWTTPHLEKFGAQAIPREEYLVRLREALTHSARWGISGKIRL